MLPDSDKNPSELKVALDNRAFEIQLFWQRTNYFLVLITALGIGVFSIDDEIASFIVTLLGVASSFLWFRTNLGSKFWQESWEVEVGLLADELGLSSFSKSITDIKRQVTKSLRDGPVNQEKSKYRKYIDGLILKKYSVTDHMITLSLISTLLWCFILLLSGFRLLQSHCLI